MPLDSIETKKFAIVCQWKNCNYTNNSLTQFNNHVKEHLPHLEIVNDSEGYEFYKCLWLNCIFQTNDSGEITWHVKYHGFHTFLKGQGDSLAKCHNLIPCTLSSVECNAIPNRTSALICLWNSCNEKSTGQIEFIKHVNFSHISFLKTKPKERIKCQWADCNLTTTKKSRLADHVKMHTGEKAAACSHCGQIFANSTKFVNHRNRQLPINERSPQCSHCLVFLPNERLLRIHMRQHVHHYKCCYCDLTCSTPSVLSTHIKYRHLPYKPFKCTECPHVCKSQNDLSKHMMVHSDNLFSCTQVGCNSKYRTLYSLNRHFEKEHTENPQLRNFACHLCTKTYARGAQLTNHLCSVHKVTKPSGYSRFEYRREQDGYFRLQTTRLESLEVEEMAVAFEDSESKTFKEEEEVDDPFAVEETEDIKDNKNMVAIDVLDDKGKIISCNMVTPENDLPPEGKVVAIGE